jgi:predicted amidophosphoribosyltransferase
MTIVENICEHCGFEFRRDHYETFCAICEAKFDRGTLRQCDKCGHTWEVKLGECGYTATNDKGYPIELCEKCEKDYRRQHD